MGYRLTDAANVLRGKIKTLWEGGKSATEIGRKFNMTRCAVLGHVHRMKLAPREVRKAAKKVISSKPRPKVQSVPLPKTVPEPIEPRHLILMALSASTCRWPYGDGPFTFCGLHPEGRSLYCPYHTALACAKQRTAA